MKRLKEYQQAAGKFSITFDEAAASHAPHRYLSMTLRTKSGRPSESEAGHHVYLGLVKVTRSVSAAVVDSAVRSRLHAYGVKLSNMFSVKQTYFPT